jgi:hypothetical protein
LKQQLISKNWYSKTLQKIEGNGAMLDYGNTLVIQTILVRLVLPLHSNAPTLELMLDAA